MARVIRAAAATKKTSKSTDREDLKTRRERMKASNTVDKAWFEERIAAAGKSMRRVAREMGKDPSAISNMLSGVRRITLEEAAEWAQLLFVPLDDVIRRAGITAPREPTKMVPLAGVADAQGTIVPLGMVDHALDMPRRADRPGGLAGDAVGVLIHAPGSAWDRCVAYYVEREIVAPEAVGRVAVVGLQGGARVLGVLTHSLVEGRWTVRSLDGGRLAADAVVVTASPVLWLKV